MDNALPPERIWAGWPQMIYSIEPINDLIEYVRADIASRSAATQEVTKADLVERLALQYSCGRKEAVEENHQHWSAAVANFRAACVSAIQDFDGWVMCTCTECRFDGRNHAINEGASLSALTATIAALPESGEK